MLWGLTRARRPTTPPHLLVDDLFRAYGYFERSGQYEKALDVLVRPLVIDEKLTTLYGRALRHLEKGSGEYARLLLLKNMIDAYYSVEAILCEAYRPDARWSRNYDRMAWLERSLPRLGELEIRLSSSALC